MPYWRVSDDAARHPKLVALSDGAFRLWFDANCLAQEFLSDGHLTRRQVAALKGYTPARVVELTTPLGPSTHALWLLEGDGFRVHDYLVYNSSKEQVARATHAKARRIARWRQKHQGGDASRDASPNVSGDASRDASPDALRDAARPPAPHPHPQGEDPEERILTTGARATARPPAGYVFRGQRLDVSQRMFDTLVKPLLPAADPARVDWFDAFAAWDALLVATDTSVENPLPWLRERMAAHLQALGTVKLAKPLSGGGDRARTEMKAYRQRVWGRCPHKPKCASLEACIDELLEAQAETGS